MQDENLVFAQIEAPARNKVQMAIDDILAESRYNHKEASNLVQEVNRSCIAALKVLCKNFKLNISSVVMERKNVGLDISTACDFDLATDGVLTIKRMNETMLIICTIFITAL